MSTRTYVGQRKRAAVTLTVDGEPTDGTPDWIIVAPNGTAIDDDDVDKDHPDTGTYTAEFTADTPGRWIVAFRSTGTVEAAARDAFIVSALVPAGAED